MFYKEAKSELLLFFFFFFGGGGGGEGGGVGRRGGWSEGIFFTKNPNKKMHILDLELAIDHPPPGGVLYTIIF